MAIISSLWINLGFAALILLPVGASGADTRCPAFQAGLPLKTVSVFAGPPEERADLVPDRSVKEGTGVRSEWSVAYVFQAGRKLFVECHYGGAVPPITLAPDASTTHCVYRSAAAGQVTLVCQGRP